MDALSSKFGPACAQGLAGAPELDALPLGVAWNALFDRAVDERAVSIIASAVVQGLVSATPEQGDQLCTSHEAAMRSCVVLERWTLDVIRSYVDAGIDVRVLKGPAVAHLDYPDPSWRTFGDIDVLVPSDRYDDAIRVLLDIGGHRRSEEVRPGFDRRFGKGACVVLGNGIQVDVHRTLTSGPFGLTIDLPELFESPDVFHLAGMPTLALSRELRLIHACYHAVLGDPMPRVVALRDVAQMLESTALNFDEVRRVASRWRAEIVLARGISLAWSSLKLATTTASDWATGYVGGRFERRALGAYVGPDRSYARQMLAGLPAVAGLPAKASYVRSLMFVDPAYAARHGGGFGPRVRRAWNARPRREHVA